MHDGLDSSTLSMMAVTEGCTLLKSGAVLTTTGKHTGRSPNAKRYEIDDTTSDIDWENNQSITPEEFDKFFKKFIKYKDELASLHTQRVYAVRDPRRRLNIKVYTENAIHALFVRNMFLPVDNNILSDEEPWPADYVLYHFPSLLKEPTVLISISKRTILISGTSYSGEIKKSIFSVLNYMLPSYKELPMHCSVNIDKEGDNPAIFFGLSGTGKTTLSSDKNRILIGDDEHAWTHSGITNFEAGCYAKTIRLSKKDEPQIWDACHGKETILENVVQSNGIANFDDGSLSQNTRASYPFHYIANSSSDGYIDKHPKNIIMLTCDAFGVLPPVAKLSPSEAYKQFLLGYTAKVAGTEIGIKEPVATFSFCFGAPFMPLKPTVYADLLKNKILEHGVTCWLVNTGWTRGPYGTGERISIKTTRTIIDEILDGSLDTRETIHHDYTNLKIPISPNIELETLFPEMGWVSLEEYEKNVLQLNQLFLNQEKKLCISPGSSAG